MQQMLAARTPSSAFAQLGNQKALSESKKARRLFIGNLPHGGVHSSSVVEFFNKACSASGISIMGGNPVADAYVAPDGKYGFIEFRSIDETTAGLALNGISFQGSSVNVRRPNDYEPAPDYIPTNVSLMPDAVNANPATMAAAAQMVGAGFSSAPGTVDAAPAATAPPSTVLVLGNMVTPEEMQDDEDYQDVMSDTKDECEKFGTVMRVHIPREEGTPGFGKIFVLFDNAGSSLAAQEALQGRMFDNRAVEATFMDESKFLKGQLD